MGGTTPTKNSQEYPPRIKLVPKLHAIKVKKVTTYSWF